MLQTLGQSKLQVSKLGLGCMGMSEFYGETDDTHSKSVLLEAQQLGINFFDSADIYGNGHNEKLLASVFPKTSENIVIATKCGIVRFKRDIHARGVNNSAAHINTCLHDSLKRLQRDCIDLYYLHRIDPKVPIEESMQCLSDLVKAGKIRYLGLSEADAETIKRAHQVHPLTAIQTEYSMWSRQVESNGVLDTCRDLNIGFVAYSPLGRGFLTGKYTSINDLPEGDSRKTLPRFQDEAIDCNLALVEKLQAFAAKKGCTSAQVALAWVVAQGDFIVPIPGTKHRRYLRENVEAAQNIQLSNDDLKYLNEISLNHAPVGERYSAEAMQAYQLNQ